jgi:hypothetical protein
MRPSTLVNCFIKKQFIFKQYTLAIRNYHQVSPSCNYSPFILVFVNSKAMLSREKKLTSHIVAVFLAEMQERRGFPIDLSDLSSLRGANCATKQSSTDLTGKL